MTIQLPSSGLGIDTTAALSMGAETIDDRSEVFGAPIQGNALAQIEEQAPYRGEGIQLVASRDPVNEPPGRPGWGMQWGKRNGAWHLVPVQSAVLELARDAEELSVNVPEHIKNDPEILVKIPEHAQLTLEWILSKRSINHISAKRKLQAEIDDISWLWCQAAKYKRDATEKRGWWTRFGSDLSDSQRRQLESLREYGMNNIREAYILSRSLMAIIDVFAPEDKQLSKYGTIDWTFEASARRVLQTSCNKLTQYFETRSPAETQMLQTQGDKLEFEDGFYS